NVPVVYKKLGNWVPNIPGQPVTPLPYPNDPEDPTVPGTDMPVIPYVPGYVPVGPDGVTPLQPVDPNDPSKGYIAPPVPSDPGVDTPITYVPVTPAPQPEPTPAPKPIAPASPAPVKDKAGQLPSTGETSSPAVSVLGAGLLITTLALAGKRRKKDEE
ncbi:TPA: LPXTG cell wall anchor domain-containing protein, partial [Streptococcus suis]|nr:LPXTG cell wall anchor domain-containing protein [Streptococcus suis]